MQSISLVEMDVYKLVTDGKSPQEDFWKGFFGSEYISRNKGEEFLAASINLFSVILSSTGVLPKSFLELGANIGMNLNAIRLLSPGSECTAIEINGEACEELRNQNFNVIESSIVGAEVSGIYEFVFTRGVLIHLDPHQLEETYHRMYKWSSRFIMIAEYYNPTPVSIPYRGNSERLFKRDFPGELMDLYPTLKLRETGFVYHRGPFPQDDITWFLLEKE